MKTKKSMKLSLKKVTVSDLGMSQIRGGLADIGPAPSRNYTNCADCSIPYCGTYVMTICAPTGCQTFYQTCGDSCVEPPLACAQPHTGDAIY